jgi:hypothetical protein
VSHHNILVTFIGGSQNLTQRVISEFDLNAYYDCAVMPAMGAYPPDFATETVVARRERYNLERIGPRHAIAVYEHIPR